MEIIRRRYGEDPRLETRAEANETVKREIRYRQILDCLEERGPSTAKQVAVWLCMTGQTPTSDRNLSAPRLTELCQAGLVEPIGKTRCVFTGKTVTVYGLREND